MLSSLISQTEYDLAVTPIYDDGPATPMLGSAITGMNLHFIFFGHPALIKEGETTALILVIAKAGTILTEHPPPLQETRLC